MLRSEGFPFIVLRVIIYTDLSEGSWGDDELVDGVRGHDEDRGERHEPANHLAPPGVHVIHVRYRLVRDDVEQEHSLAIKKPHNSYNTQTNFHIYDSTSITDKTNRFKQYFVSLTAHISGVKMVQHSFHQMHG